MDIKTKNRMDELGKLYNIVEDFISACQNEDFDHEDIFEYIKLHYKG